MIAPQETPRAKILIVEDEVLIGLDLKTRLENWGYSVIDQVFSAEKALERIEQDPPDLILMDIILQGKMDGIEAAEIIRNRWGIPVIFTTAYADREQLKKAKLAYPFGYLIKPYKDRDIDVTLEMALYVAKVDGERRKTEEKLRENEKIFHNLFNNTEVAMFRTRLDGSETLNVNEKFLELVGRTREEVIGKPSMVNWVDPKRWEEMVCRLKSDGRVLDFEFQMFRKSGEVIDCLTSLTFYPEEGILEGSIQDFTERKRAEEELRHSEQKFMVLFNKSAFGLSLLRLSDGVIVDVNETVQKQLGFTRQEMIGKTAIELGLNHDPQNWAQIIADLQARGFTHKVQMQLFKKDGSPILIQMNIDQVEIGGEKYSLWCGQDITERKRAEEQIQANFRHFESMDRINRVIQGAKNLEQMMSEVLSNMLAIFDSDRTWLFYPCDPDSPTFRVPMEVTKPEYPGAGVLNVDFPMPPDMAVDLREALDSNAPLIFVAGTDRPINRITAELFGVKSQIVVAVYPASGKPWVLGMHQCSHARVWTSDETRLFKEIGWRLADGLSALLVHRDLQESEEKYRTLFNNVNDSVFLHEIVPDAQGRFILVNDRACQRLGYNQEEMHRMTAADIDVPEQAPHIPEILRQLYAQGYAIFSTEHMAKDGSRIPMEINVRLVKYQGRDAVLSVGRDITERKQAEEKKKKLEERLNQAEKMEALGTLAGGVAHDLNNVLGIIAGFSEMLLYEVDEASSLRIGLTNIMDGSQRAAAIVQDLLTLTRRGVATRKVLNVNQIVFDCQRSLEFERLFFSYPSIKIKIDLESDLLNISGSSVHLGKTLFNLISNACEAMPKGGELIIKTFNQYLDRPVQGYDEIMEGDYVVLSVSDNGEGISAIDRKRIFEPFYTKKIMGRSGTGLGLAVVWGTIKDHHGYINVESQESKGTTFTLYFPVTREDVTAEETSVSISEYLGKGESILVVDDVQGQRDLARDMLKKLNYLVASVPSGEEAVTYLKEHRVDLLILDMIMDPGMDGLDTYKKVLEIHPQQKAIIVSGYSESERVHAAQTLGAGAYVKKPYVMEKLGLAVRRELNKYGSSPN